MTPHHGSRTRARAPATPRSRPAQPERPRRITPRAAPGGHPPSGGFPATRSVAATTGSLRETVCQALNTSETDQYSMTRDGNQAAFLTRHPPSQPASGHTDSRCRRSNTMWAWEDLNLRPASQRARAGEPGSRLGSAPSPLPSSNRQRLLHGCAPALVCLAGAAASQTPASPRPSSSASRWCEVAEQALEARPNHSTHRVFRGHGARFWQISSEWCSEREWKMRCAWWS